MTKLEILGLGVWSPYFSNWKEFSDGINGSGWKTETKLQPNLIPPRERRRAPLSVKLAVEVMSQACEMAHFDPSEVAAVFSSSMGDMQIKDYLCRSLATPPRLVSPTQFHNSVHNATLGYWSIASHSHASTNAISAHAYSAPMALLEAAIQSSVDDVPILLVTQEMAAPSALYHACPSDQPFSSAILLTLPGRCAKPLATIEFEVESQPGSWPDLPNDLAKNLESNPGARLIPLLSAIAARKQRDTSGDSTFQFPITSNSHLKLRVMTQHHEHA